MYFRSFEVSRILSRSNAGFVNRFSSSASMDSASSMFSSRNGRWSILLGSSMSEKNRYVTPSVSTPSRAAVTLKYR